MTRFLVIAQGAGDYHIDYSVKEYDAVSAQDAADQAIADGYGTDRNRMNLFVARMECVTKFVVTEQPVAHEAVLAEVDDAD